MRFVWACLRSP
uniref:Uncharacterized protein n=1 Tax=Arundo donax TaxID=35708 RepID=A0A0A8Y5Z9_ARUDO